ncbi:hypothetical protein HY995_03340, partial [Candidatus Micrarchaeota archaeon]|nr:hypothetical protein [Candidatus Micrarchaeota archaeon]
NTTATNGTLLVTGFASLPDGKYNLTTQLCDYANNCANYSGVFATIDTNPPNFTGESKTPSPSYVNDTVVLEANITDNFAIAQVWVETNATGTTANYSVANITNGNRYNSTFANITNQRIVGWKFWANDSAGNTNSTALFTFMTQNIGLASPPNPTGPINSSTAMYNNVTFNWTTSTDPDNDSLTYEIQASNSTGFETKNTTLNITGITAVQIVTNQLPNQTITMQGVVETQYWRVRARDAVGLNAFNNYSNFTVIKAQINISAPNINSIVRPGQNTTVNITELLGGDWINNATVLVNGTQTQLTGNPNWTATWTVPTYTPQILTIQARGYNQTMNDPTIFVTDSKTVRLGRAENGTQTPALNYSCANSTYAINNTPIKIIQYALLDTLLDSTSLTLTLPNGTSTNLTAIETSTNGYAQLHNYTYTPTQTGNYTINARVTDMEGQAGTFTTNFTITTTATAINISATGLQTISIQDTCNFANNIATNTSRISTTIPDGIFNIKANTSSVTLILVGVNLTATPNITNAINFTTLTNATTPPNNTRRVKEFQIDVNNTLNYTTARIMIDYSDVASTIGNESALLVVKCTNTTNCNYANLNAITFQNNKTIFFNVSSFSVFMLVENTTGNIATITNTVTVDRTVTVSGGGGLILRTETIEKNVTVDVKIPVLKPIRVLTAPGSVVLESDNRINVPIQLSNDENVTFRNLTLRATSDSPQHVGLNLSRTFFAELPPGTGQIVNLTIRTFSPPGYYNITVNLSVHDPPIEDSTPILLNLVEKGGALKVELAKAINFARDLFKQNPDCLELSEFLRQAGQALNQSNYTRAKRLIDLSLNSCRDLIAQNKKTRTAPVTNIASITLPGDPLFYYALAALAALTLIAALTLSRKRLAKTGAEEMHGHAHARRQKTRDAVGKTLENAKTSAANAADAVAGIFRRRNKKSDRLTVTSLRRKG